MTMITAPRYTRGALAVAIAMTLAATAQANDPMALEEVVITGTRATLRNAIEAQREANYAQASHYAIKVRAAGLDSKTLTKASWAAIDVECLARMEHERWMAMKWYAGWEHDVTRDDAARRHPDLVPYDQLSEDVKKHDRNAVHNVIEFLPDLVDELRKTERR